MANNNDGGNRNSNRGNDENGTENMAQSTGTSQRGFASLSEEERRRIASEGGKAAHQKGTAHQFTSEEGREAGKKGGESRHNQNQGNKKDDDTYNDEK